MTTRRAWPRCFAHSNPRRFEVRDRFGCLHQIWRKNEPIWIAEVQKALEGKELFLADGHHRYAAGWNLATIQIRSDSCEACRRTA